MSTPQHHDEDDHDRDHRTNARPERRHLHEDDQHGHSHGVVDPTVVSTSRGIWAIKWSFFGLGVTAVFQVIIFLISGSVALLADTIHNVIDASTAVPLLIAFLLARRKPNSQFRYGYSRSEDLAGAVIVLMILISSIAIMYQSVDRLFNPQPISYLWVVALAGAMGFIGNELVAIFRIKIGREIHSAALIADGHHARADGLTSLSVVGGAIGVWLGFPAADPIIGLVIGALILKIVWDSAKSVFSRMLDGVDPHVTQEIAHAAAHSAGVVGIADVRARWMGHKLAVELHVTVEDSLTVISAHAIGTEIEHTLRHEFTFIGISTIHVDPVSAAGLDHHNIPPHQHGNLPLHAH